MGSEGRGQHTPGPWRLAKNRAGDEYGAIYGPDESGLVATTGYLVAVGSGDDMANARLIAAAPEMAEVVLELLARIDLRGTMTDLEFHRLVNRAAEKAGLQ